MFDFKRENAETAIMDITPETARQLLSTSPGNRKIRQWHVDILAGSMTRGQWKVTSQGIGIDRNGKPQRCAPPADGRGQIWNHDQKRGGHGTPAGIIRSDRHRYQAQYV